MYESFKMTVNKETFIHAYDLFYFDCLHDEIAVAQMSNHPVYATYYVYYIFYCERVPKLSEIIKNVQTSSRGNHRRSPVPDDSRATGVRRRCYRILSFIIILSSRYVVVTHLSVSTVGTCSTGSTGTRTRRRTGPAWTVWR